MAPGGITTTESGSIMAVGAQGVNTYRMIALRSMLSLEIKTGMKMSRGGSPMKVCKELCGSSKNTKKGVYVDFDAYLVDLGYEGKPL